MSASASAHTVLVIGLGNELRGDDSVGLLAAEALRKHPIEGVRIETGHSDATAFIDIMAQYQYVLILDAFQTGGTSGTVQVYALGVRDPAAIGVRSSSHSVGIVDAVKLARTLHGFPKSVTICGIEGSQFGIGERISEKVLEAIPALIECVLVEINHIRSGKKALLLA